MNWITGATLEITPAAELFIRRMVRMYGDESAGFRIKVRPGGCSGLAVDCELAAEPAMNEVVWPYAGLRIFVDPESRPLLSGATVDFKESFSHSGFVVTARGQSAQACGSASAFVSIQSLMQR